ncbi:MAG: glycerate kinase [Actinobacteria bacterium]|nr:glycerate kinase [Actinomycetota bacterium]
MLILIAPDKFKGTLGAPEVAAAIAEGVKRVVPDATIELRPLGDGGEGTMEALRAKLGGRTEDVTVTGPLGGSVEATITFFDDGRVGLETAAASGLTLVAPSQRDALAASSRGTGELLVAALRRAGPGAQVIVGIGGSASTDGGTGAADAGGWRFLDGDGRELPPGGGALTRLARIDGSGVASDIRDRPIIGACDIDNPLLGERGSAPVFAPQKGASRKDVEVLEAGLGVLSATMARDLGVRVADRAGAGAAGGLGAGLAGFFGAKLRPGFEFVAEATALERAIRASDLVITGEGLLDDSSLGGKVPVGVARMARRAGVPCAALAGDIHLGTDALGAEGISPAAAGVAATGRHRAMDDTKSAVADTTERLMLGLIRDADP